VYTLVSLHSFSLLAGLVEETALELAVLRVDVVVDVVGVVGGEVDNVVVALGRRRRLRRWSTGGS